MGTVGILFSYSEPQFSFYKKGLSVATLEYDVLIISGFIIFFLPRLQTGESKSNPDSLFHLSINSCMRAAFARREDVLVRETALIGSICLSSLSIYIYLHIYLYRREIEYAFK